MTTPAPRDAGTVPVRVQVIDPQPRVVDLVVPTYLKADDLTQRIARDAGLGAWWDDGTRRRFWLRARGRVLLGEERLADVGVVPYELLHLLPEPPPGAPVVERPLGAAMPPQGRTVGAWLLTGTVVLGFAAMWAVGLGATPGPHVAFWPAVALAWWTGRALPDVPVQPLGAYLWRWGLAWVAVSCPAWVAGAWAAGAEAPAVVALALLGGLVGGLLGYLARLGPVQGRVMPEGAPPPG